MRHLNSVKMEDDEAVKMFRELLRFETVTQSGHLKKVPSDKVDKCMLKFTPEKALKRYDHIGLTIAMRVQVMSKRGMCGFSKRAL